LKVTSRKFKGEVKESLALFKILDIEGVRGVHIRDHRVVKLEIPLLGEVHVHISRTGG
jgi:hypothetical protein